MNTTPINTEAQIKNRLVVCIDNGHGKNTQGKCSPDRSLLEWQWTRQVALLLRDLLIEKGIDARLVVTEEKDILLSERCRRINSIARTNRNTIAVSVHVNAAGGNGKWRDARGWSVYVSNNASYDSKRIASMMYDAASENGVKTRKPSQVQKYWQQDLAICRDTVCPAVLVENFFMDNKEDCEFLKSDNGKKTCAEVMLNGILEYYCIK